MVTIHFYTCTAEKNRIDKTTYLNEIPFYQYTTPNPSDPEHPIVHKEPWKGTFKEDTSIINPVFTVKVQNPSTGNFDFNDCNYCLVSEFNRYYFIKDIVVIAQGTYRITCHVDVLMSNKRVIQSSTNPCVISRSQSFFNAKQASNIGVLPGQYVYKMYDLTKYGTGGASPFHRTITMTVVNAVS